MIKGYIKEILAISALALLLTGCGSSDSAAENMLRADKAVAGNGFASSYEMPAEEYYEEAAVNESGMATTHDEAVQKKGKKLIYNYDLSIQTQDFEPMVENVYSKINELGGYVESSNTSSYSDEQSINMTVRLPQDAADDFLNYVGSVGNVTSRSESVTDRTLEYVDMDARMNAYKDELNNLRALSQKAETVDELLQIENAMADVRGRIDSYQSQLNSIDDKVNYSTVSLYISEVKRYSYTKPGFWEKIAEGLAGNVDVISDMVTEFIISVPVFLVGFILFMIPFTLVLLVLVKVFQVIFKKKSPEWVKKLFKKKSVKTDGGETGDDTADSK